jgi:hypothetical protein
MPPKKSVGQVINRKEKGHTSGFHGVYLLSSLNPKCIGKAYIGYTNNPYVRERKTTFFFGLFFRGKRFFFFFFFFPLFFSTGLVIDVPIE